MHGPAVGDRPDRPLRRAAAEGANDDPQRLPRATPGASGAAPAGGSAGPRGAHDVISSVAPATARGSVGVVTSAGRLIRLSVLELPALPPSAHAPGLAGGAPLTEFMALAAGETVVGLASLGLAGPTVRPDPRHRAGRGQTGDTRLPAGARGVRADRAQGRRQGGRRGPAAADTADLVFVTSDGQLLRFGAAASGRRAGRPREWPGIRLSAGARVVWFGSVDDRARGTGDAVVVTVAGSAGALPGTAAASVKVAPYADFPPKGRGTGGVRCHRFLKGEDELILAWAGSSPALGATAAGSPVDLPGPSGKRDGSGVGLTHPLAVVGTGLAAHT